MTRTRTRRIAAPGALVFGAVALLSNAPASAGEIFGKVLLGNKPAGDGTTVAARCGDAEYPAKPVDKGGAYHIVAGKTGKCTLTITANGQSATVDVVSYDEPVEADIVVETKDGKLSARRR